MGRASSFAPDAQKAQLSAARIFNLANREPEIDNYDTDGEKMVKMVKFNPKNSDRILYRNFVLFHSLGDYYWTY